MMTKATFTFHDEALKLLILYLRKQLFQIPIYKNHLYSSKLCNMTFSQANTSKKSWTSRKNHLKNAFSPKLADHNLTSIFNRRLHMLVFNETELQLFTTSTWLGEIYITNCFKSSEPG